MITLISAVLLLAVFIVLTVAAAKLSNQNPKPDKNSKPKKYYNRAWLFMGIDLIFLAVESAGPSTALAILVMVLLIPVLYFSVWIIRYYSKTASTAQAA